MTRGILSIAFGSEYDELAAHTALTTQKHTDLPIHLISNLPCDQRSAVWDKISNLTHTHVRMSQAENRVVKTNMVDYTPFDQTLYIDCDAVVQRKGVECLFDSLDEADIALYPYLHWSGQEPIYKLYLTAIHKLHACFPITIYRGACMAFRKTRGTALFFSRWHRYWRAMGCGREMHVLACAGQHAPLDGVKIAELPESALAVGPANRHSFIQHDYGYGFCKQFDLPQWEGFHPYDRDQVGQWDKQRPISMLTQPNNGEGLCIAAYSWGWYNEYIPLFAYFALGAYPGAHLKIYTPEETYTSHVLAGIKDIHESMSPRVELISNYKICPHFDERKHARWVLPEKEFADFKYIYIGDVDMFIAAEQPDLVSFHVEHAQAKSIPYSNLRRWNANNKASGLHFMIREPYYHAMRPIMERYIAKCPPDKYMKGRTNEQFLCHMLTDTFGPPPKFADRDGFETQRPHHGFHMGLLRSNKPDKTYYTPYWKKLSPAIQHLVSDALFDRLTKCIHYQFAYSRVATWVNWLKLQRPQLPEVARQK